MKANYACSHFGNMNGWLEQFLRDESAPPLHAQQVFVVDCNYA